MICKRCQKVLTGKQTSYCSFHCSRSHLKSLYRQRNKEKVNEYKRAYRKKGKRPMDPYRRKKMIEKLGGLCLKCGTNKDINIHHWRPARLGGRNDLNNLTLFCFKCHQELHLVFKMGYWSI